MQDVVNNAVVSNADTVARFPMQLAGSGWKWSFRKTVNRDLKSFLDFPWQLGQRATRRWNEFNGVAH
jgi:hypothetical protein